MQRTDEGKQRISKCTLALKKSGCGRRVRGQTIARGGSGSRPFSVGAGARKESPEHVYSRRNSWEGRGGTHVKKESDG